MRFYINEIYFFAVDVSILFDLINSDYNIFDYNQRVKHYLHYSVFTGSTLFYYVNKFFYVKYNYNLYYDVVIWKRTWVNNFYSVYYYWDHLDRPFRKIKAKCTRPLYMNSVYAYSFNFLNFDFVFRNFLFLGKKHKNLDFLFYIEDVVSVGTYYCLTYYNNIIGFYDLNQNFMFKAKIYFYFLYGFFYMVFIKLVHIINVKLVNLIFIFVLFSIFYLRKLYFFLLWNLEELYESFVFEDDVYFGRMKILSSFFIFNVKKYLILLNILKYLLVHIDYFRKFVDFYFSEKKNKNLLRSILFDKPVNKNQLFTVFFVYFFFEISFWCVKLRLTFQKVISFLVDTLRFIIFVKFPFTGYLKKTSLGVEIKGDLWKVNRLNQYEFRFVSLFKTIFKIWFDKILKRESIAEELLKLKKDFKELSKKHSIFTRSYWKKWAKIRIEQENYAVIHEEDLINSSNYGFYQIYSLKNSIYFFFKNLNVKVIEFEFKNIIDKILIEILDFSLINWRFYIFEINAYLFFSYIYYFRIYFFFYYIYCQINIIDFFNTFIFKSYLIRLMIYYYSFFIIRIVKNRLLSNNFFNFVFSKLRKIFFNFSFEFSDKFFFYLKLTYLSIFRVVYYFINFHLFSRFFTFFLIFLLFYFFFDFNIIFFIFSTFLKLFYIIFYFLNEKLFNSFFFSLYSYNAYLNYEYFFYIVCVKISWSFDGRMYDLIPFYRFLYKEAVETLEFILNTLQLLFTDIIQLILKIHKSIKQWWKERGWRRRVKIPFFGRIVYIYYYLIYYFYLIFPYSFQIFCKGFSWWVVSYGYFFSNWFYYFSHIFFFKIMVKNYYLFFLFWYFKYLFKIFTLFLLYFIYYSSKLLSLMNFNMELNIFMNFFYMLKISFYYSYFFINDIIIFVYNITNYMAFLLINVKFIGFYHFFWVDMNLVWSNLLIKITTFYYELMKNIFQFEHLRFNFKKFRRVRKQRGAFRRFRRFYDTILYHRERGLISEYYFKGYNLLYVHNFYLSNDVFKLKWYGLKQIWNYYIWFYFILETWISYLIFLNVILFLSLALKRELKEKRDGLLFSQDYSWQRINQESLHKITPVEHFRLSSFEIAPLEIISYDQNKGLRFNLEKVDFAEDAKIVKKTRMPKRFTFSLVERDRKAHFKHFAFFEEYFYSRLVSYKTLIRLCFIKYIRGVRNREFYIKDFNFDLLYNYYYKFDNLNWVLKEFEDIKPSPVINYFLKNYLFFNLSSSVMFINNEDFEKRRKFYDTFYVMNEDERIHILDYKFASEETYDHFMTSGAFDEEKRIANYWSEMANSYSQTFFLFSVPDREYSYNFHKRVDRFFDKLYELDYYFNYSFSFNLYDYKNKYIQYKTRLSADYMKEHFVNVLYDRKQFYTIDDTDAFPTEYLLKEDMKRRIDLAYSYKDDDSYLAIIDKWAISFSFWAIISFFFYSTFINVFIIKAIWNKRLLFYIGFLFGYLVFFVKFFSKSIFFYFISSKFYYRRFWRKARRYSTYRINRIKLLNFYYSEQNFSEFIFYFFIYTFTFRMLDPNELFGIIFSTFLDLQLIVLFMLSLSIWIFFFIFRWNGLFSKK